MFENLLKRLTEWSQARERAEEWRGVAMVPPEMAVVEKEAQDQLRHAFDAYVLDLVTKAAIKKQEPLL